MGSGPYEHDPVAPCPNLQAGSLIRVPTSSFPRVPIASIVAEFWNGLGSTTSIQDGRSSHSWAVNGLDRNSRVLSIKSQLSL